MNEDQEIRRKIAAVCLSRMEQQFGQYPNAKQREQREAAMNEFLAGAWAALDAMNGPQAAATKMVSMLAYEVSQKGWPELKLAAISQLDD